MTYNDYGKNLFGCNKEYYLLNIIESILKLENKCLVQLITIVHAIIVSFSPK